MARLARALTAAVAATALVTTGLTTTASAVAPPPAALTFYAPSLYHPGAMGVNGDVRASGTPLAGATVALQTAAAETGPFTTVATTTTGSTGKYVFYTPFSKTAWYRASFAGNASAAAAVSRTLKVVLGPLPTRTLFWAPDVHGTGLTPMNGVIQGGWDFAGDTAVLEAASSSSGPWSRVASTTVTATSISNWGTFVFRANVPRSGWYRARYLGSATSQPSLSLPQYVLAVPGLLLWKTLFTGNQNAGSFTNTRTVRVSISASCGSRVFGGTRFKVFDTTNRLVLLDVALTPNTHVQATRLFAVQGWHDLLVQTYCPGQISVRTV